MSNKQNDAIEELEAENTIITISFSGGLGSFASAHYCKDLFKGQEIELVFCDTLIEDEDLYRFIEEASNKLELPLVKLSDGRNPWQVFTDMGFQGNSRIAPCSKVLKTDVIWEYIKERNEPTKLVLGMNFDEPERYDRAKNNWRKRSRLVDIYCPLVELQITEEKKNDLLKFYDIEKPRLYKLGFPHNNCGGFCVRAGLSQFALLKREFPDRFIWHKEQQNNLIKQRPEANKPFLRKQKDGVINYITLEEFESMKEKSPEFDFGGCGCFVDDEFNDEVSA